MPKKTIGQYLVPAIGGLALVATATTADAAGFQLKEQSAEGQGNSFAGSTAKALDASTIFYNPAGMSELEGHQVQGNVSLISVNTEYEAGTIGAGQLANGSANLNNYDVLMDMNAIVPATYGVYDLNKDIKLGISVNSPFGLRTNYDNGWAGSEYNLLSKIKTVTATPTVSYRINDQFSIGAGVAVQHTSGKLTRRASAFASGSLVTLQAEDVGVGGTLGLLYKYSDQGRIGVGYRSRIKHTLEGSVQVSGAGAQDTYYHAEADLTTPDILSVGWYHKLDDKWAVMSDVAWTNWSVFDSLDVVRKSDGVQTSSTEYQWDDTFFFSLGASYQYNENLKLNTGIAYDQGAANDEHRTAGIPDSDRYWFSLGGEYKVSEDVSFTAGYSYLHGKEAKVNDAVQNTSSFSGEFSAHVHILSAGFNYKF